MSDKFKKVFAPAAWVFYLIIGVEILYMISPFALYYYSTYGPSLNFLHNSPATAWLTGFFLPHFAETSSSILNLVHLTGEILMFAGFTFFFIGAGQIYYYKFAKKGAVTGGIYKFVRHPQYVAFAITGIGLFFIWPRFTVLIMFVSMLFVYYWLARKEEKECEEKFGESYRSYKAGTAMFIPGIKLSENGSLMPKSGMARTVAFLSLYLVVLITAIGLAFGLRNLSISKVSTTYSGDSATISVVPLREQEMEEILQIAYVDPKVQQRLKQAATEANKTYLNYVVPQEWYLPDVPIEKIPEGFHGHHQPDDYNRNHYKVLITKAKLRTTKPVKGPDIIKNTIGREPIILVKIDRASNQVTGIETPPPHVRWGDIPTPLF